MSSIIKTFKIMFKTIKTTNVEILYTIKDTEDLQAIEDITCMDFICTDVQIVLNLFCSITHSDCSNTHTLKETGNCFVHALNTHQDLKWHVA